MFRAIVLFALFLIPASAMAQKVGDRIAFVRDSAVMSDGNVVGTAYRGVIETVRQVDGDRLAIIYSRSPQGTIKGTVSRDDVIPITEALEFFSEDLKTNPTSQAFKIRGDVRHVTSPLELVIKDYDEAIRLDPQNFAAWIARASAWGNSGDDEKAIENATEAVRLNPQYALPFLVRGMALQRKHEFQKALGDLDKAAEIDPQYGLIFFQRADALAELKQYERAMADYKRAMELDPLLWHSELRLAWILASCPDLNFRDGKLAIQLTTGVCERTEWKYGMALAALAAGHAQEGNFEEAINWQTKAQSAFAEPEATEWASVIGYYKAGKAWPHDDAATAASPNRTHGHNVGDKIYIPHEAEVKVDGKTVGAVAKGNITTVNGITADGLLIRHTDSEQGTISGYIDAKDAVDLKTALTLASEELQRAPTSRAYAIRGSIFGHLGQTDQAVQDFDEALRLDSKNAFAWWKRGNMQASREEYEKAITDFDEAIRLEPKAAMFLQNRATVKSLQKNFDGAITDYDLAIRLDPRNGEFFYNRAFAWSGKGEHRKAIADLNEAVRLDPNNPAYFYNRGFEWAELRNLEQSLADYSQAIRLSPKDERAWGSRAIVWRMRGEFKKSRSDYQEAVRLAPMNAANHANLARLLTMCPDAEVRDGQKAVEAATKACELSDWRDAFFIDTLAAAYAESGNFQKAIEWQTKADGLYSDEERNDHRFLLELYKAGKSVRAAMEESRSAPATPPAQN